MFVIPSRLRPHNIARLIGACGDTGATAPALIRIDDDDPTVQAYLEISRPPNWDLTVAPRNTLSSVYNEAFKSFPGLAWYGVMADDIVPETRGWDKMLIAAAGRNGLAYGDDGINGGRHATHFIVGGDLVRAIGFLAVPGLDRLYIDTAWNDIARKRNVLRYLPEVRLTHMHFSNRLSPVDETYRKFNKAADKAVYEAWKRKEKR